MCERIEGSIGRAHSRSPKKRHPSILEVEKGWWWCWWWLGRDGGSRITKSIRDNNKNRYQPER